MLPTHRRRGIAIFAIPCRGKVAYLDDLTRGTGGRVVPLEELDAVFGAPDQAATGVALDQ